MSILENIINAFHLILLNKLRSWLSMLWIIIWVASVIVLVSIWEWATKSVLERVQSLWTNLVTVIPWASSSTDIRRSMFWWRSSGESVLKYEHVEAIRNEIDWLNWVTAEVSTNKQIIYNENNTSSSIVWTDTYYPVVKNFNVEYWQFISEENIQNTDKVAVIWVELVESLFDWVNPIGEDIVVWNRIFTVIWIMEEKWASWFSNLDDIVLIPITTAQKSLIGSEYISTISVSVADYDEMDKKKDDIESLMYTELWITSEEDVNFTVLNQADSLEAISEITWVMTMFLWWIAAISLMVWWIWVMNIMLVSVTERIKEIWIKKAIWATNWDILSQFLIESVVLSILWWVIWIMLSYGIINVIDNMELLEVSLSMDSVFLSFWFSAFVWVFFWILPAYKASKLKPIDALRFE